MSSSQLDQSDPSVDSEALEQPSLSPEQQQEARLARRCFTAIERICAQIASYPPGHPAIEQAIDHAQGTFHEFFQITDRLSVQVHPHSMKMLESGQEVWETDEPRDYCFVLSRDGVFLLHILAGVDRAEIKRLVEVLNHIIEERSHVEMNAVQVLFEAGMRYISYDALDESMAALAGVDLDMRNRDTKEEKEIIDDLFNKAFDAGEDDPDEQVDGSYEVRVRNPAERMRKVEVGSREFLSLDDEARAHLSELKRGFTEHAELEHREGEILSAILGARPKPALRQQAVDQIGQVMGELLRTLQPWEALTFLKLIHQWRDRFAPEVATEIKDVVAESFDKRLVQELVRQVTQAPQRQRRMILQMFNALHLEGAPQSLADVVGWTTLEDDAREDITRFLKERARYGFDFLEQAIKTVPEEYSGPLFDILEHGLPASREVLLGVLNAEVVAPIKARALRALSETFSDPIEVRDRIVPLVRSSNSELRVEACRVIARAAPQHIMRVMEPLFDSELSKRPEEEVREMAMLFIRHGGGKAASKIESLIRRRGITTSESERDLAVWVARSLIRTPHPAIIEMLDSVSKDWLVSQRIRTTCKEVADMLRTGSASSRERRS